MRYIVEATIVSYEQVEVEASGVLEANKKGLEEIRKIFPDSEIEDVDIYLAEED